MHFFHFLLNMFSGCLSALLLSGQFFLSLGDGVFPRGEQDVPALCPCLVRHVVLAPLPLFEPLVMLGTLVIAVVLPIWQVVFRFSTILVNPCPFSLSQSLLLTSFLHSYSGHLGISSFCHFRSFK